MIEGASQRVMKPERRMPCGIWRRRWLNEDLGLRGPPESIVPAGIGFVNKILILLYYLCFADMAPDLFRTVSRSYGTPVTRNIRIFG